MPFGRLQQPVEQRVGAAEVQDRDGVRLSVDALGLDDAPVGVPMDSDLLQACHG
ncbi:MAG: hypothetical protein ACE5HV_17445 [Acidobacteriota bacterium]